MRRETGKAKTREMFALAAPDVAAAQAELSGIFV